MAGEKINLDYITEYLHEVLPESEGFMKELELYAEKNGVPIIHPEVRALLDVICKIKKPNKILEVGTAIGYSAINFALCSDKKSKVVTIERDSTMTERALINIEKANLSDRIHVLEGEALEVLDCLNSKYDIVFIDAAKGYYNEFLDKITDLINDGGLIISDNVLYKGMTAEDSLVKRRQKTIVGRMREYLYRLCHSTEFTTSIIPIGDGVALTYYKKGDRNE